MPMSGSNAYMRVRPALLSPLAISGGGGGVLREGGGVMSIWI